jgi:oxygen-independent coproporphyrinogen-3 oxidase
MEYELIIESGRLPVCKGLAIDDDDVIRADAIQALMCYDQLDFDDFGKRHNISFRDYFADELARLETLAEDRLIEIDDSGITVTACGRLLMRNIAMQFDRHLHTTANSEQFSKAI